MSTKLLQEALGYEPLDIRLTDVKLTVFGQVDSAMSPDKQGPGWEDCTCIHTHIRFVSPQHP